MILLAAVLFTNGVEVLGHRLKMHQGTTGSVLAAVGTAMPETIIPIIAIVVSRFQSPQQAKAAAQVAIGAITGAPFMLGTLGFLVTGLAVLVYRLLGRRSTAMTIDRNVLSRDLSYFLVIYAVAVAVSFLPHALWLQLPAAAFLLAAYVKYLRRTIAGDSPQLQAPDELYMRKWLRLPARLPWVVGQLAFSLAVMIGGADMFVHYVEDVAATCDASPLVLSLIITPIATELPEKFNSVIWVRRQKDALALGNMTGAMVFQSSFPAMFGVLFTPWDLLQNSGVPIVSAVLAGAAALLVLVWVRVRKTLSPWVLISCGLLYAAFIVYAFVLRPHLGLGIR